MLAAQQYPLTGSQYCSLKRTKSEPMLLKTASPASPRHTFDVLDYKLTLDLYKNFFAPFPRSFSGSEVITFRADSALNTIQLNAVNTSLQIDSVGLAAKSFSHQNNILTLTLDATYAPSSVVKVKINYTHLNTADNAIYVSSDGFFFTDCEPEGARKWFPCWDARSGKATFNLTAQVPPSD